MDATLTFFSPANGVRLYYEWWMPALPKAILLIVHGIGEHSGRYGPLIRYFGSRGFGVAIFDQRGQGNSGGPRGHFAHFQDLLGDLAAFTQMVKEKYPGVPTFMIGHSFGGQVVLNFVVRYSKGIRGILLSSPNIQLLMKIPPWKRWLSMHGARWFPKLRLRQEVNPSDLSHDPEVVKRYETDPLVVRHVTLQAGMEIMRNLDLVMALASRIHLPAFFMHAGDDHLCAPEGTRRFFRRIPVARKQLKIYDGFAHEIFNEVDREQVFHDMEQWILDLLQEERTAAVGRVMHEPAPFPTGRMEKRWAPTSV